MQQHPHTEGFLRSVAVYRAYRLDSSGHIISAQWIDADTDIEAEALAETLCGPGFTEVELWCGTRRVSALPCPPDPEPEP